MCLHSGMKSASLIDSPPAASCYNTTTLPTAAAKIIERIYCETLIGNVMCH